MSSIATTNETSNVTSLPSTSKAQTAKEVIAANVKLLIEQLEAGHSEGLTAYLTAMGRFHNYSFGNILEIARQKPDATRVAGMYAWNQLGRKVIKGKKGTRSSTVARNSAQLNFSIASCFQRSRRVVLAERTRASSKVLALSLSAIRLGITKSGLRPPVTACS
jgi:hypothetical protein